MPIDRRDSGSMVIGWLVKVAAVLTIIGIIGFDGVSMAVSHLNAQDDANSAASAAAETWQQTHNVQQALQSAIDAAGSNDTVVAKTLVIDNDGTVHLSVQRHATTLLMYRLGPLKKYVTVTAAGEASPPTS